ncbi:unnamed protein product, partial [Scytosiphon promiscuus]
MIGMRTSTSAGRTTANTEKRRSGGVGLLHSVWLNIYKAAFLEAFFEIVTFSLMYEKRQTVRRDKVRDVGYRPYVEGEDCLNLLYSTRVRNWEKCAPCIRERIHWYRTLCVDRLIHDCPPCPVRHYH